MRIFPVKDVVIVIGAGQIGMTIAQRIGFVAKRRKTPIKTRKEAFIHGQ